MARTATPLVIPMPPDGWHPRDRTGVDADRLARRAMVCGILSFVLNPLFLASVIGVVYGRRALLRGTAHRSMAIAGIVTGALSALVGLVSVAVLVPLSLVAHAAAETAMEHGIESSITTLSAQRGTALTAVRCPVPHDAAAGTVLTCSAQDASATPVRVQVTFTSASTFTAQVLNAG